MSAPPDRLSTSADCYSLSPMQQGMLFHHLLEPRSGADIEQMVMRVHEPVDTAALAAAWNDTMQRHEVLRTAFRWDDVVEPVQHVGPAVPMEIVEIDQSAYDEDRADARLHEFLATDRARGFDLAVAPLSRLTILRRRTGPHVIVWTFHHIILDGRSFPIVLADVFAAYDARRTGRPPDLPASVSYRTFIEWLQTHDNATALQYWRSLLEGFSAPTPLRIDGLGGAGPDRSGFGEVRARLDRAATSRLEELAGEVGVTLNTMVQGAWSRLLAIYSGETDVVFGSTRACRYATVEGSESIAGLFINTLPMRVEVAPEAALPDWLRDIRAQHVAMRAVEHTALVEVQAQSDVQPGTRLFDSILVFETYQLDPRMRAEVGTGDRVEYELHEQTNYPLLLSVYGGDGLDLRLEFDRSRLDPATAERMVGHVVFLLEAMIASPSAVVGDLDCLGPRERDLLVHEWNPAATASAPLDMVTRWRAQVDLSPDAVALVAPTEALTYAELDERSDALAHRLGALDRAPRAPVGVLLDRSVDAAVALLAALKAGCPYLPLDPGYPTERLEHMILDSAARVVITSRAQRGSPSTAALLDRIEDVTALIVDDADPTSAPDPARVAIPPEAPAYVIYTSGSTGTPKGVVVSHGALVNHADGVIEAYALRAEDRVLQFAALSFDVAAEELFPTWLAGAAVVLRSEEVATDFEELHRFVGAHEVSVCNLPAAFWSTWVDHLADHATPRLPDSLRLVVTGSEKVATDQLERWTAIVGSSVRWLNAYGPTEATITASVFDPRGADPTPGATAPIGRPITNVTIHILDDQRRPTPLGIPGELYIGGRGVAIGYHDRAELTAEKFVSDPFSDDPKGRLYRTGDLARWLPDGNVDFLGRVDDQVKVRGFRIELGEVEAALRDLDGVADAVVIARPDAAGSNLLEAHVMVSGGMVSGGMVSGGMVSGGMVSGGTDAPAVDALRAALGARLPSYMVPVGFALVDSLPLTPSGKVDRLALAPVAIAVDDATPHIAPRTRLERDLATAWNRVLGTEDPGIRDNFFEAGGNSLSAIRLFSATQKLTGTRMQLADLFAAPTIEQLAARLGDVAAPLEGAEHESCILPWVFPIKESGTRPPLFHLGGASVLVNLAKYLPEDQPLYALLEQDLEADHFFTTVEDIVPHCIQGLRSVQPHGPYLIAGLCFGGVVALEMSRQLRAAGEAVALTLMIDSFAPGTLTADEKDAPSEDLPESPYTTTTTIRSRYRPSRVWSKLRERAWRASWGHLHEFYRRRRRPLPAWLRDVEEANTIASDSYQARPYHGDVTLLMATHKMSRTDYAPLNGWGDLIQGRLDVAEVVGGHLSVYAEPHVADLAAKLNARLDAIQASQRHPELVPSDPLSRSVGTR